MIKLLSMKILQLTPGSGDNFYCENCIRDLTLVRALRSLGHEVTLVPMYLPLQIRKPEPLPAAPIFFGGINVFLQQKSAIFRKLSPRLDRWLDHPALLKVVARFSSMTRARDLAETTISMLEGMAGHQKKEIDRLLDWLESSNETPDVILLSNILLSGLAEPLKKRLNRPVVCLLQDEDGFLDDLQPPWSETAWGIVKANAAHIQHFVAVSDYFGAVMRQRLGLDNVSVAYPAVDCEFFTPAAAPAKPVIGFLARMSRENGLDLLVDAFAELQRHHLFAEARLLVSGGSVGTDADLIASAKARIAASCLEDKVEFIDDYDTAARKAFLQGLSLICVPMRRPVACGMFALEAMACGVPFLQPANGVFVELAESGGGVVLAEVSASSLSEAIIELFSHPARLQQLRESARRFALQALRADQAAAQLVSRLQIAQTAFMA